MAYATVQSVLEEAGLQVNEVAQNLTGTADGSNAVFYTPNKPIADTGYDDAVTTADITVYVDGSIVTVSSVVVATGAITLAAAPTADATVTADYSYTSVNSSYVEECIEEAETWVNDVMSGIETTPYETASPTIRKITRYYAAGLLMAREYGLQSVTEESTKEGERKIKQAEKWLNEHRARVVSNSADTNNGDVLRTSSRPRLFQQYDSDNTLTPLDDEHFTTHSPY